MPRSFRTEVVTSIHDPVDNPVVGETHGARRACVDVVDAQRAIVAVHVVFLEPTLSPPIDDFVAALNGLGKTPPRIARYERQLATIGARIANGCPRVGDDDKISRIDRKLDKLGNELSQWDAAAARQARVWFFDRAIAVFKQRALIAHRSSAAHSRHSASRSHARSRTPRRRRCSASRARTSGDADGEPPGHHALATATKGAW